MNRGRPVVALTFAYSAGETLRRCIDSVLCQRYENLIYYICDDGSKDNTREIIMEYALNDSRVRPIYIDDKSRRLIDLIPDLISTILLEHEDGYFISLDADDEYKPDFLEKMLPFVLRNDLDLAICGSDSIDTLTGDLLIRKELGYDLVLSCRDFSEKFLVYRRYIYDFWGKLYTFPVLKNACIDCKRRRTAINGRISELFNYTALSASKRVGLLGESLHKYYIFPNSYTSRFIPGHIEASAQVYDAARSFLLSFGEMDKINQDYLYAIYMGQMSEILRCLFTADLLVSKKLEYVDEILSHDLMKEMLEHEADPRFINLAGRDRFITGINEWITENGSCNGSGDSSCKGAELDAD